LESVGRRRGRRTGSALQLWATTAFDECWCDARP